MKTVKVYAFKYLDREAKAMRLAADMATASAIHDIGGEVVPESAREVKATLVGQCGLLMAAPRDADAPREDRKH